MKKVGLLLGIICLLALFWQLGGAGLLTLDNLKAQHQQLLIWRDQQPLVASVLFFLVYVLVTALSIPGAVIMTLAGGAVFGLLWGTLLISFASTLGASCAMLASRYLISGWVRERFGQRLSAIDEGMAKEGAFYLFTLRLLPVFPFFLINLLMGLTQMPVRTFWWVSQLGMLAGTLVYVNAGTELAGLEAVGDILSPGLIGAFALLGVFPWLARMAIALGRQRQVYRGFVKPARFDRNVIVVGAGSGGLVSAYIGAAVQAKVTLVEKHQMGGDCLNTGCVPSKALIRVAKQAHEIRNSARFGISTCDPQVDFAAVMARVKEVIQQIAPHDSVARYTDLGVEVIEGEGKLVSPWAVQITTAHGEQKTLTARAVIIASGARPRVPDIPGLTDIGYLTTDTLWELNTLPKKLLILGGGPVGCELAQAFSRLGSEVTLVQRSASVLPKEDSDVQAAVADCFAKEGIALICQAQVTRVERCEQGVCTYLSTPEGEQALWFDHLLLAVGREASTDVLLSEQMQLEIRPNGTLSANGCLQTRYPNVYVCGDGTGPYQFTHVAAHQAWYAAVNALFSPFYRPRVDYRVIPHVTFLDPEVARVGLNERQAQHQGIPFEVTRYDLGDLDRAIADGNNQGFVKVLTVPGKDTLLGVTIVGAHGAELLAEFVLAMKHGLGLNKILGTIHAYPSFSEANKYAAGAWRKAQVSERTRHILARFHRWRRE